MSTNQAERILPEYKPQFSASTIVLKSAYDVATITLNSAHTFSLTDAMVMMQSLIACNGYMPLDEDDYQDTWDDLTEYFINAGAVWPDDEVAMCYAVEV